MRVVRLRLQSTVECVRDFGVNLLIGPKVDMALWYERPPETEIAIKEMFTKLGYPAANPEELEAVKEFMKGKYVFVFTPYGSGKFLCSGSLPLVSD